jgi:hypothetical protein
MRSRFGSIYSKRSILVVAVGASTATISAAATVATAAAISATAAATTVSTTTAAATAGTAVFFGPSFVAGNSAPGNFLLIQTIDRCLRLIRTWHLNESETTRTTCLAICNDTNLRDLAKTTESLTNLVFRSSERQVTHINIRH